jgi:hypothetical protein
MGYTHYWYKNVQELDLSTFKLFVADCKKVYLRSEVPLAGWSGAGKPKFTSKEVSFNGVRRCGHAARHLGIMWPAENASGINSRASMSSAWFAGAKVMQRTCDGDCSHETFSIDRVCTPESWERRYKEGVFSCCKTAFKPYDLLVTACLIIAAQRYTDRFIVTSDGESQHWDDARRLCQHVLGYGQHFCLSPDK